MHFSSSSHSEHIPDDPEKRRRASAHCPHVIQSAVASDGVQTSMPDDAQGVEPADLWRVACVGLTVLLAGLGVGQLSHGGNWLALTAVIIGGIPIYRHALEALRAHRMTMELSMTVALGAALGIGESFTALVIVFFVLGAEILEGLTVQRGRQAIERLVELLPQQALVRRGDQVTTVPVAELHPGDVVVVRPGSAIPIDGMVLDGHSVVDQSTITGESRPVEKSAGAEVYAGTMNHAGALDIRVDRIGEDTAYGRIIRTVEDAEKTRAPVQRVADQLAGYLVVVAVVLAGITFLLTRDLRATISVVIVAGACGVAAGTPLALLGAIGRAARMGAVIKGGLYVETLARVDTVAFDKTGTLTIGHPAVSEVIPAPGISEAELLRVAAACEVSSEHPLALAVLRRAEELGIQPAEPINFDYLPGKGVTVSYCGAPAVAGSRAFLLERGFTVLDPPPGERPASEIWVAHASRWLGRLRITDPVRPEAAQALKALRAAGVRTVLLTGDGEAIARDVATQVGLDDVESSLLPHEKAERIRLLQAAGRTVAMLGDGINDAPALTAAGVGVAMGSGTDVARESADVLLIGNDLLKFVEVWQLSRRCRRIIFQNFAGTLVVDGIGMLLAALGWLSPLLAAFIHVSSELGFLLNSARLLPRNGGGVARRSRRPVPGAVPSAPK